MGIEPIQAIPVLLMMSNGFPFPLILKIPPNFAVTLACRVVPSQVQILTIGLSPYFPRDALCIFLGYNSFPSIFV